MSVTNHLAETSNNIIVWWLTQQKNASQDIMQKWRLLKTMQKWAQLWETIDCVLLGKRKDGKILFLVLITPE
jgi:hypothetical protein